MNSLKNSVTADNKSPAMGENTLAKASPSMEMAIREKKHLRFYSANSPQAKARLVALALLADGRLDDEELDDLGRRRTFAKLGLTREEFFQVLYDFCADVSTTPNREDNYLITPEILTGIFAEVTAPEERRAVLRLIFDVIRSDGRLALGEARLFWNAVDAWPQALTERSGSLRSKKLRRRQSSPVFALA